MVILKLHNWSPNNHMSNKFEKEKVRCNVCKFYDAEDGCEMCDRCNRFHVWKLKEQSLQQSLEESSTPIKLN